MTDARTFATRLIDRMAEVMGASALVEITSAHVDGCLHHGRAGIDFAERLVAGGARVAVPTTLNVGSLDLLHPDLYRGPPEVASAARHLMDLYVEMGCTPTWTCAPYQLPARPAPGEHIAWAESNAIVFANSVLGARTNRYGDFMDICAAIAGCVPYAGLHDERNRRGTLVFRVRVPDRLLAEDAFYHLLGHVVGAAAGGSVPVIDGLPRPTSEDRLKAIGAAAASSGSVALFHAVGITPEAATLEDAVDASTPAAVVDVTTSVLARARAELTTGRAGAIDAVSIGTPHYSAREVERLVTLLGGGRARVPTYVSTSRAVLAHAEARGWLATLEAAGVQMVTDTCTYVTPILDDRVRTVMTDSAKWAYYAPGNLGIDVVFGTTAECIAAAVSGVAAPDEDLWRDG